jgi:hypothetical protein
VFGVSEHDFGFTRECIWWGLRSWILVCAGVVWMRLFAMFWGDGVLCFVNALHGGATER